MIVHTQEVNLVDGDVSADFEWAVRDARIAAWDIETSGLDWRLDRIATCQLHVPNVGTQVIRMNGHEPERLRELLTSERVVKVFHHAPFDLRFMRHHWKATARSVACTKILSKIVRPEAASDEHSLKPTLERFLGVVLDKRQQTSDWLSPSLTQEQLTYAVRDVEYLVPLLDRLMDEARASGVADIAERTFEYLPTRVETDIRGCGDVFAY
ncbi:MAG: ribonuclease [Mycobacterium sp.]|nr:ribonuclease [Mycobacterium sp.]